MIVALAGGVGASKLLWGLCQVMPPEELTVVVNTGDDIELHGLRVSPDLDIVTYTLAGLVDREKGWGLRGDTFRCQEMLGRYGNPTWFNLGDGDLATHIYRTQRLREGATLSRVAEGVRQALGVRCRILPMTDTLVQSRVVTEAGPLHFQEYLVRDRCEGTIRDIVFEGAAQAKPAPGVLETIRAAEAVLICPSNPIISIGPILAVPGIRAGLSETGARVVAVSPVVAGASLKGPTDKMLGALGIEVSALGVAQRYRGFLDVLVMDAQDAALMPRIEALGVRVVTTNTIMSTPEGKRELAATVLRAARE